MALIVHILCALTGLACAGLLARAYWKAPSRLLLWSIVCFVALSANSVLAVVDIMLGSGYDLRVVRLLAAAPGLLLLLFALITERD